MHTLRILLGAMCLSLVLPLAAQAADPPPLSAYGQLPEIEDMALSLSGTRLAALTTIRGERILLIMDDELRPLRTMAVDDVKVRSIDWIGDDRLLVQISQTEELGYGFTADQHEFWRALIVPVEDRAGRSGSCSAATGRSSARCSAVTACAGPSDGWTGYFGGIELVRGVNGLAMPRTSGRRCSRSISPTIVPGGSPSPGSEGQDVDWLLGPDGTVAATFAINTQQRPSGRSRARRRASARGRRRAARAMSAWSRSGPTAGRRSISRRTTRPSDTRWFEVPLDGSAAPAEFLADEDVDRLFVDRASGKLARLPARRRRGRPGVLLRSSTRPS